MNTLVNDWTWKSNEKEFCVAEMDNGNWLGARRSSTEKAIEVVNDCIKQGDRGVDTPCLKRWLEDSDVTNIQDIPKSLVARLTDRLLDTKDPIIVKCECGGACTTGTHSSWCPKYHTNMR